MERNSVLLSRVHTPCDIIHRLFKGSVSGKESRLPRFHSSHAEKEANHVTGQRVVNASAHTADCDPCSKAWDPHVGPPSIAFTTLLLEFKSLTMTITLSSSSRYGARKKGTHR